MGGPISWTSKRQKITARSTAEAEIYATDEAVKHLIHLQNVRADLIFTNGNPIEILNDNNACVLWSKNTTTKGLRHIQIRENSVRESIANNLVTISHVSGDINPADIFTKEDKDLSHFIKIRDTLLTTFDALVSSLTNVRSV